jgi:formylglycine-generating enzyme required for sulfatase activity
MLLGALLLLSNGGLRSEEIIHFELVGENADAIRLAGAARIVDGDRRLVLLTDDSPQSLGAVWAGAPVAASSRRILAHFEYSLSVPGPMPVEGELGGGIQLIFAYSGEDLSLKGGESLGVEPAGTPYLGVAIDLGEDGDRGPSEPHFEINRDSDPGLGPSLAVNEDIPDVLSTGLAGATVRVSTLLENGRLRVLAATDHGGYGARVVFDEPVSMPRTGSLRIGIAAACAETSAIHRLHSLDVRLENPRPTFLRGDCNQDGSVCGSVSDLVRIVQRCFLDSPPPPCEAACDADGDGRVCGAVTDVVYLASYCFLGSGMPPPAPWPGCAAASEDSLSCEDPTFCGSELPDPLAWLGRNDRGHREYFRLIDSMPMVEIPAGHFEQGDAFFDFGGDELPVHRVTITEPFLLAKFEVSNRQYRKFLEAIGCDGPRCAGGGGGYDYTGAGSEDFDGCHYPEGEEGLLWARNGDYFESLDFADHPVVWIDWFDAVAYSRWANTETSTDWEDFRAYGLPTESQWEYSARWRGEDASPGRYPWGGSEGRFNSPVNINTELCNHANPLGRTDTVCSRPAGRSWFGLYNQGGNVYEWTADWYVADAYTSTPRTDPFASAGAVFRQLRGGGWFGPPFSIRSAYRCSFRPRDGDADVGFRPTSRAP